MTKKITTARITDPPKRLGDPMPIVYVTLEGEEEERELLELFTYYPDEISFTPQDFIGLTVEQAHRLKLDRDQGILVWNGESSQPQREASVAQSHARGNQGRARSSTNDFSRGRGTRAFD
jgi:hypothetical protein